MTNFIQKMIFVIFGIFIFRLGSYMQVPGIDPQALALYSNQISGTILDIFNTFSGGSIERFSILAVGIAPYISASIIIQMSSMLIPFFQQLKDSGQEGQLKLNYYTRYLTLSFAFVQSFALTHHITQQSVQGIPLVLNPDLNFFFLSISCLVFGSMFLLWLGEKLTEYGVGSGISVIIFAGIVSSFPDTVTNLVNSVNSGSISFFTAFLILIFFVTFIYFIIFIENSFRKIKLTSASYFNDEKNEMSLKINISGVIPVIFASTLIVLPATILNFFSGSEQSEFLNSLNLMLSRGQFLYFLFFALLIMFFSFFYSRLVFDPKKTSDLLRKQNSFLKGIRPGKPTEKILSDISFRLTFIGGLYLILIAIFPEILLLKFNIPFYLGGTSILIITLVSLEWYKQYNLHLQPKQYNKIKEQIEKGL